MVTAQSLIVFSSLLKIVGNNPKFLNANPSTKRMLLLLMIKSS